MMMIFKTINLRLSWQAIIALLGPLLLALGSYGQPHSLRFPTSINLTAGVFLTPPFAILDEDGTFHGFEIDLLERMQFYADQDGIELNVELGVAPRLYDMAIDLVSNDCNTTVNPNSLEDCEAFDFIIGDFFQNVERFKRVDFTPTWLHSGLGVLKYLEQSGTSQIKSLSDAEKAGATICYPPSSFIESLVHAYMPTAQTVPCPTPETEECIQFLKDGNCALLADDLMVLQYMAKYDSTMDVTQENIQPQYFVWALKQNLQPEVSWLLKKWMYQGGSNGDIEVLRKKYFEVATCPTGTAGENCELPCDAEHGFADAHGVCVCHSTKWTGDDCSIAVEENLNLLPTGLVNTVYTLVAITFVTALGCAIWVLYNRNRAQLKAAQPVFLGLVLLGAVISTSTIIAMAQEGSCMAVPWLYSVGFCITFGSLFARIWRVYVLVRSAVEMRRVTLSTKETLGWVCVVLAVDIVILVVWTAVDPLEWTRETISSDKFGEPLESVGYCHSDHWRAFASIIGVVHLVLMAVACFMCYRARHIPEEFSSSKYIAIAMFSNLQIFVIAIPVLIIVGKDPVSGFFVRSLVVWLNDIMVVGLVFGSLISRVYIWDMNNRANRFTSAQTIERGIQDFSKRMKADSLSKQRSSLTTTSSLQWMQQGKSDAGTTGETLNLEEKIEEP
ncbi:acid type B receptor subunit 2 [Seminavis robusta]|uniref:Acid type B receptor subunit 2 n=1 Tax=Seminavis robusta TaxID=568900 RepID=A0A9N8HYU7_9STRA|nr:acid type B receptor subunit 2 [Seminavis robusta]|eukprot:Sro2091_g314020.1 acid type B receptor subunit 2 (671) ;mRNA; f:9504-11720